MRHNFWKISPLENSFPSVLNGRHQPGNFVFQNQLNPALAAIRNVTVYGSPSGNRVFMGCDPRSFRRTNPTKA